VLPNKNMKVQGLCSACGAPCVQTCKLCGQGLCATHSRTHNCGKTARTP